MSAFTEKDYPALVPYLVVKGAAKAIEFYQAAFGAQERYRLTGSSARRAVPKDRTGPN